MRQKLIFVFSQGRSKKSHDPSFLFSDDRPRTEDLTPVTILEFARAKQAPSFIEYKHICNLTFSCTYTQHQKRLFIQNFSAIIAHGHSGHVFFNTVWQNLKNKNRRKDQIWISESMESSANPSNYNILRNSFMDSAFNWTFFASPKATFMNSYFYVEKRKKEIPFESIKKEYRKLNKSKSFCWIVSNCGSLWTKRFDLAAQIIQELPDKIHMWGSAAKRCLGNVAGKIVGKKNCFRHLQKYR